MYQKNLAFHFVGIGGSGMSGIAEILLAMGFEVSGSDLRASSVTERLIQKGACIQFGHHASHIPQHASLVVYTSAVDESNPELQEAKRRDIPLVRRAEVLAELMRLKFGVGVAGSHGKTTTTTMIATVLERGGLDPTVIVGGLLQHLGSGARSGKSEYLVAETDESDRSFLLLTPTVAVVTNIDSEHLGAYESFGELIRSFEQFVGSVPFYGLSVLCIDCRQVREIFQRRRGRKVSFGFSLDAMYRAVDLRIQEGSSHFTVLEHDVPLMEVRLPLPGAHFASNSLAAIAVGREFGLAPSAIASALTHLPMVKRRCEVVGAPRGIHVISDYGHHPTEIRATIEAIKAGFVRDQGRLHVVFQPHRYSRTRDCFREFLTCFEGADLLFLTEIYGAHEAPIEGISGASLAEAVLHPRKSFIAELGAVPAAVVKELEPGDTLLCLGAGSIGMLAPMIIDEIGVGPHGGTSRPPLKLAGGIMG